MSKLTEVLHANRAAIARATTLIENGGLVAFPTETVYGLGANALDADAVANIFRAKGRPATNPVIVHIANREALEDVAVEIPPLANVLAEQFWPGPLTLVLPRGPKIPDVVTAGGPTVAVRVPAHPVAADLLHACKLPIAAPSANRSMCLSPTRAEHVLRGLDTRIDLVLDGGPCPGGLESTVLDVTTTPPTLLRPGLLSLRELEAAIGPIARKPVVGDQPSRSPGQMSKHYSPVTPIDFTPDSGLDRVRELVGDGVRVGWLAYGSITARGMPKIVMEAMPNDPSRYSARLYDALHRLDDAKVDRIVVALPPEDDAWLAVHDRLSRMR